MRKEEGGEAGMASLVLAVVSQTGLSASGSCKCLRLPCGLVSNSEDALQQYSPMKYNMAPKGDPHMSFLTFS